MWRVPDRSNSNSVHYRAKLDYDDNLKLTGYHCNLPRLTKREKKRYIGSGDPRGHINRNTGSYNIDMERVKPLGNEINKKVEKMRKRLRKTGQFLADSDDGLSSIEDNENVDQLDISNQIESEGDNRSQINNQIEINDDDTDDKNGNINEENENKSHENKQTDDTEPDNDNQNSNSSSDININWSGKKFSKRNINRGSYHDEDSIPRKRRQKLPSKSKLNQNKSVSFHDNAFNLKFDDNGDIIISDDDSVDDRKLSDLQRYKFIYLFFVSFLFFVVVVI